MQGVKGRCRIRRMIDFRLDKEALAELHEAHRKALNVREAYRINAVILLAEGWTAAQVGEALLLNSDSQEGSGLTLHTPSRGS